MQFEILRQHDILSLLPFLGQLRIDTFREFPYLYVGTPENELKYTKAFANTDHAFLLRAMEGESFAGLVTVSPLQFDKSIPQKNPIPFDPSEFAYFGEVIVSPAFRHRGVATELMQRAAREARRQGFPRTCFLCVERAEDHPLCPPGYQAPDELWRKLGYQKTEMRMRFTWNAFDVKGIDNPQEHWMVFWMSS